MTSELNRSSLQSKETSGVFIDSKNTNMLVKILMDRVQAIEAFSSKIKALENSILGIDFENINIDLCERVELYERMCRVQIAYMDLVRRMMAQANVRDFLNAMNLSALYDKFMALDPVAINKVSAVIDGFLEENEQ
jgi:hypothetical protein